MATYESSTIATNYLDTKTTNKEPSNPVVGQKWTDTSKSPPVSKIWNGSKWEIEKLDVGLLDEDFYNKVTEAETASGEAKKAAEDAKKAGDEAKKLAEEAIPKDEPIKYINLTGETVKIGGGKLWLTAQTVIDDAIIKSGHIVNAAISTAKIDDLAVTTAKIGTAAITEAKIGNAAIVNAHIKDATIESAKIKNILAEKIIADDLSVISAKTGDLSVDKTLTMSGLNSFIKGVYAYGDKIGGAFKPTYLEGNYKLGQRHLNFNSDVFATNDAGVKGNFLGYVETYLGGNYFKQRFYSGKTNRNLHSRFDLTSEYFQLAENWDENSGVVLRADGSSSFESVNSAVLLATSSLTTARINPYSPFNTFLINEFRDDIGRFQLSATGAWLNLNSVGGYAELWVGKDSANKQLVRAPAVKSYTTSSAANVFVSPTGILMSNSSSERFKINITTVDDPIKMADKLLSLDFKSWNDRYVSEEVANELTTGNKNEAFDLKLETHYGLIAEEVEAVGLGQFVTRDEEGRVDGLQYAMMWTPLIPKIKQLEQEINQLKNQINQEAS